jgi:thiol-disulfide isomerase/thioredoxin
MSDAIYPKASKAPKASKLSKAPTASARPADDYEDYDSEYDEYDEPYVENGDEWEYDDEERTSLVTSPSRAIALGIAGVALLAVFSAVIWLMSTSQPAGPPLIIDGPAGGVPVIQGFAQTKEAQAPAKGAFAPDFVWNDNNQTVALSSFRGSKPVFVNFWGTWCPPCRSEMPAMEAFYQQHKNEIQMIGVSMYPRDDPTTVLNFVRDAKYSWKFIHDGDYKVAEKYQVASVPSSYFIDTNGVIKAVQVGAMNQSQIESYFQQVRTTTTTSQP